MYVRICFNVSIAMLHTYMCIHMYFTWIFTGPSGLTVNIVKNTESLSIDMQWDIVDDFLFTTYTITWTDGGDLFEVATVDEQTSYTITGLTLDTVYTITVTAANMCGGQSPEFSTRISFPTGTTSTIIAYQL